MRRHLAGVAALGALLALGGCRAHQSAGAATPAGPATSVSPRPTVTVTRSAHVLSAGEGTDFAAQAGVSLRLTASKPRVSRGRLSRSYGYSPARGYYVTFTLTIVNTGSQPIDIGPPNFHLRIPGEGVVTAYDGNAPYSGAPRQLDNTELDPGDRVQAPLTFDVRSPHGVLMYLPDRSAAITWRF